MSELTRTCEHCSRPFPRKPSCSPRDFATRRFCSAACGSAWRIGRPCIRANVGPLGPRLRAPAQAPLTPPVPRDLILALADRHVGITGIVAALHRDYPELTYRAVQGVLDRRVS